MDPKLTAYTNAQGQEIRIFSNAVLQRQIDSAIARFNPTKHVVVVAHTDNESGVNRIAGTLLVKLGDDWSVAAAAYKEMNKPLTYGAEVVWTPF